MKKMYVLMTGLVLMWGLEYIVAKNALAAFDELSLVFYKYVIALFIVGATKLITDRKSFVRKKDIPLIAACAIVGDILYFTFEYKAMSYIPVSLVAVIAAFVPVVSIIIERIVFKKKVSLKIALGMTISIMAVCFIIGFDYRMLLEGRMLGYIFAFGAVLAWNAFNFATARLAEEYDAVSLTLYQMLCVLIMLLPYVLAKGPDLAAIDSSIWLEVLFLGVGPAAIGFMIYVKSLDTIGVTPSAMFVNFIPVSTAIFGWLLLKEQLTIFQLAAGVVIIAASCVVIVERGKQDKLESGENL